jgi:four helix bundle protein
VLHVEGDVVERVEDLKIWQRASELGVAVNATLARLEADRRLRDQLLDATDSVLSNIAEGFQQPTDRAFAKYLYISKTSNAEARTRLKIARDRGYITQEQCTSADNIADEVARMITGLIKYLLQSDRRDRGIGHRSTRRRH